MNVLEAMALGGGSWTAGNWWLAAVVTVVFAGFARAVRGVTASGAVAGAAVCFALTVGAGWGGFAALCAVFLLTLVATRFGYSRKQSLGTAEARAGRNARQVLANVGVAAGCAVLSFWWRGPGPGLALALTAALSEAAADTVSSEIGQAVGGEPRLITSGRKVQAGTDGGITLAGTLAGVVAAIVVSAACASTGVIRARSVLLCAGAGILGTIVDSLLGATVERRRLLGNNGVNFLSTLAAAVIGLAAAGSR